MKKTIYIPVKVSEELPKEEDAYYVDCGRNGLTSAYWNEDMKKWQMLPNHYEVMFWLKPIEYSEPMDESYWKQKYDKLWELFGNFCKSINEQSKTK